MSGDLVGEELDQKYRIVRRLGGGGFGDVFLAEDDLAGRQVAIKRLRNTSEERQADLVHEMRALDQLHHRHYRGYGSANFVLGRPAAVILDGHSRCYCAQQMAGCVL